MTKRVRNRSWIASMLEDVPVVEWDRFVVEDHDGDQCVKVYGWIDRDDDYKDFVLARFWPDYGNVGFTTSSDEWSEYLHHEWLDGDPDGHNPCRRVEDAFDVENCIELHEESSIDEFVTDGGIERFVELPTADRFFQKMGDAEFEMRVLDSDDATVRTQFVPGGEFGFEISCEYTYAGYDCNQHITLDREAAEALYERLDRVLESDRR